MQSTPSSRIPPWMPMPAGRSCAILCAADW